VSEYELLDLGLNLWGNAISILAIDITVLSGYLAVAYIVGSKLKTNQLVVINFLYIGISIFLLLAGLVFVINAAENDQLAFQMTTQRTVSPVSYIAYVITGFFAIAHIASLWFMWNIRKENRG